MARIRSIKPEFWTNEKLSSEHIEVHMIAAALLTYADDEGYFNANPKLVVASCSPLRELVMSPHEILMRLTTIGYIRLGSDSEGRRYGHIVKFTEHQKVQHPSKTKYDLKSITWDTFTNPHEVLMKSHESFTPDQGTGNREQGEKIGTLEQVEDASPDDENPEPEKPDSEPKSAEPEETHDTEKPPVNGSAISLGTFLARCRTAGEKPISQYRPVWEYAERIGIPEESVTLCWHEFVRRYGSGGARSTKRYRDWRRTFRNCVEENWFGLWTLDEQGRAVMTSKGRMAERALTQ